MKQLLLDFTQAPPPTFANYVPGRNAEALAALRAAAGAGSAERLIYMWGDGGSGKSHLLGAFAAQAAGAQLYEARDYPAGGVTARVLAIDHLESLPEASQVALFNAFNERTFDRLVVAARAAPAHVALRRDLATRLATGLTYRIVALSDEEKLAALCAHADSRGFALADDVARYLITHARRDMNTLVGALDSLDRYSLETGRPVTLPLLKAALQPQARA